MTGNDKGNRVGCTCPPNGPGHFGLAELGRDGAVGQGLSTWDQLQGFPDFPLKGRCLNIQGKRKSRGGTQVRKDPDRIEIVCGTLIVSGEMGLGVVVSALR